MKAPPIKRKGRAQTDAAPGKRLQQVNQITPERQIVEHLQAAVAGIERSPLLTGKLGCEALDCLELMDKFRARYRDRVKQLLSKSPDAIPGWHVSETPARRLSCDTARVFDALSGSFLIDMEEFLAACSTSLTAVRNLLVKHNPHWSPDEIEHALNRALSELISFEKVIRLSRSKDKQIELSHF